MVAGRNKGFRNPGPLRAFPGCVSMQPRGDDDEEIAFDDDSRGGAWPRCRRSPAPIRMRQVMRLWAPAVGAGVGFAVGGPIGAAVGAGVGGTVGAGAPQARERDDVVIEQRRAPVRERSCVRDSAGNSHVRGNPALIPVPLRRKRGPASAGLLFARRAGRNQTVATAVNLTWCRGASDAERRLCHLMTGDEI